MVPLLTCLHLDRLLSKKWTPAYMSSTAPIRKRKSAGATATVPTKNEAKAKNAKKVAGELSMKGTLNV